MYLTWKGREVEQLLTHLFPGSSASNPIDMLATGNAEQLGICIDFCETSFEEIDGIVVIFGTPGLAPVFDVYEVLHQKMLSCTQAHLPGAPLSYHSCQRRFREFLILRTY